MSKTILLSLIGVLALLLVSCSVDVKPRTTKSKPQKPPAPPETITPDELFTGLIANGEAIKGAKTTLAEKEGLKMLTAEANRLLRGKHLQAVLTIHDVRMKNDRTASLSVTRLSLPSLKGKKLGFRVGQGSSIDLPMDKAAAIQIKPGQKIKLIGPAKFRTGDMLSISMPRPYVIARITYTGIPLRLSILTMSPKQYAFVQ